MGKGGRNVSSTLIPGRFLLMISHLLATLVANETKDQNIIAGLSGSHVASHTSGDYEVAKDEMSTAFAFSIMCFLIQFMGLLFGCSMFFDAVNCYYIGNHFVATVILSFFTTSIWSYTNFTAIVFFLSVIPAIVELLVVANIFVLRSMEY